VTGLVRTVLGDVDPAALGALDYHEHLFQVTSLLPGDEPDDEDRSRREAELLRDAGAASLVEATPWGLGRQPAAVARISVATGLHVIHTSGAHREGHYAPDDPLLQLSAAELADLFAGELFHGLRSGTHPDDPALAHDPHGRPVRAGLLKAGAGYWSISPFERRTLEAVGTVSAATDVPVMVHLEHGSAAHEVLDLLEGAGCRPDRVVLAHIDRNLDPGLHLELAGRGAQLGYDGFARHRVWPDSALLQALTVLVESGAASRILLGGDVARRTRYVAYGGMPGLAYLFDRFVPRLRDTVGDAVTHQMLVENPARWLAWNPEHP
jgi:5-phospho-D-xylono-1,4-lactonase